MNNLLRAGQDTIYCTTEISYYLQKKARRKQEREADEFAAYFLIPDEELSEYFGVTEEMVGLRVTL